jgi:hypothetical protein
MPAFVQLVNTRARELAFQHQSRVCWFAVTTNSYKFISHAPKPRAIYLPQMISRKDAKKRRKAERKLQRFSLHPLRLCVKLFMKSFMPFVLFCGHRLF